MSVNHVSIVIPCYQQEHYLRRCVGSCLPQMIPGDEIIVVIKPSSYGDQVAGHIRHMLLNMACAFGVDLRVVEKDCGIAAARNFGWQGMRNEWIKFLDADDLLLPLVLEQFRWLPIFSDFKVVFGGMLKQVDGRYSDFYDPPVPQVRVGIKRANPLLPSMTFARRSALEAVGGFSEQIGFEEDWDLWLKLYGKFGELTFARLPFPVCYYWISTEERKQKVRDHSVPWTKPDGTEERIDVREYFRRQYGANPV